MDRPTTNRRSGASRPPDELSGVESLHPAHPFHEVLRRLPASKRAQALENMRRVVTAYIHHGEAAAGGEIERIHGRRPR